MDRTLVGVVSSDGGCDGDKEGERRMSSEECVKERGRQTALCPISTATHTDRLTD